MDSSEGQDAAAPEVGLDPTDWAPLVDLGKRAVEAVFGQLASVRAGPVWRPMPPEARRALDLPFPAAPQDPEGLYQLFCRHIRPYALGNTHPRFWGWVTGSGTAVGALAEFLAAGMNTNLAGWDQSASLLEPLVVRWMTQALGLPEGTQGLLVGGGSLANLLGLAAARQSRGGFQIRREGLGHPDAPRLVLYGSTETHSCIQKAVELMGMGSAAFRRIPTDADDRIRLDALEKTHAEDLASGRRPFCVVANAGTVNTGAVDDLVALAAFARARGLWLHVDGAFGALCALGPRARRLVRGLDQADSIALDFHKWLHVPYDAGCILVRPAGSLNDAFQVSPPYLTTTSGGPAGLPFQFADAGIELSRGFRALKVWMTLSAFGFTRLGELIDQNVAQARHLRTRIEREPELEPLGPAAMNIVCFRYRPLHPLADPELDALNRDILLRLQVSGFAVPSSTVRAGRFCLRVAITNHRTRRVDLDALVDRVLELGRSAVRGEVSAAASRG